MAGPAPTPTEVLKLRGSTVPGRKRTAEPKLPVKAPACPAWLPAEAKAEWRRQVKHLTAVGVLAEADRGMLAVYCAAWARYVEAEAWMAENGDTVTTKNGYPVPHPKVAVRDKAAELLVKVGTQFGFAPSARTRLQVPSGPERTKGVGSFARKRSS